MISTTSRSSGKWFVFIRPLKPGRAGFPVKPVCEDKTDYIVLVNCHKRGLNQDKKYIEIIAYNI
jgi:hypothetical protein